MAQIEIDTKELHEKGLIIQDEAKKLNDKLNDLFKRIENVPVVTGEWVGASSVKYVDIAKLEKNKYYKLKDDLNSYGKFLCDVSDSFETCISEIRGMF